MKKGVLIAIILFYFVSFFQINHTVAATQFQGQLIIINKSTNKLAFFEGGELQRIFDVGTGKSDSLTPEGSFKIVNKIKNRPYYKEGIPGGDPSNPLGDRWLGLDARGTYGTTYAIHGNNNPASIGKYVSAGCVRMHNDDVHWLFDRVQINTRVFIGHYSNDFEAAAIEVGYDLRPPIQVVMNGQALELEQNPRLVNNRVLVPLRAIFSTLGASVKWEQSTQSITATKGNNDIKLIVGSDKAWINGTETILDVPAEVYDGFTLVPIRFVSEALDAKLSWDQSMRVITIEAEQALPAIDVIINGKLNPFLQRPYVKNGTTMVPLRGIFEELGARVQWDQTTRTVSAYKNNTTIILTVNSTYAFINGQEVKLAVPPEVVANTTFVPARFISEAFSIPVLWDATSNTVIINKK